MYVCMYVYICMYSDILRYIEAQVEHGARECRAAVKDGSYCTRTNAYTAVHRCMYTHTHKCHLRVCILRKTNVYKCV